MPDVLSEIEQLPAGIFSAEVCASSTTMQSTTPSSTYYHPQLIQLIQQPPPEHINAVHAVHEAEALVQGMRQALVKLNNSWHRHSYS